MSLFCWKNNGQLSVAGLSNTGSDPVSLLQAQFDRCSLYRTFPEALSEVLCVQRKFAFPSTRRSFCKGQQTVAREIALSSLGAAQLGEQDSGLVHTGCVMGCVPVQLLQLQYLWRLSVRWLVH